MTAADEVMSVDIYAGTEIRDVLRRTLESPQVGEKHGITFEEDRTVIGSTFTVTGPRGVLEKIREMVNGDESEPGDRDG